MTFIDLVDLKNESILFKNLNQQESDNIADFIDDFIEYNQDNYVDSMGEKLKQYMVNEISTILELVGYEQTINYLDNFAQNSQDYSISSLFINSPIMDQYKQDYEVTRDISNYQKEVKEGVPCPKCGNTNTKALNKQTRSNDEGATVFYECNICPNTVWRG